MKVLIAGGGVAGLEAALTLRELAPEQTEVTMLAPDETFEIRALSVRDAFGRQQAPRGLRAALSLGAPRRRRGVEGRHRSERIPPQRS